MKLKPKINVEYLQRPYNTGTMCGVLIGMGIAKIIIEMTRRFYPGIFIGFVVLIVGGLFYYKNY